MKYIVFLLVTPLLLCCLDSCKQTKQNDLAYKRIVYEGVLKSNAEYQDNILELYRQIQDKSYDPLTAHRAVIWGPKADSVYLQSELLLQSISAIESLLCNGNGRCSNIEETINENCINVFYKKGYTSKAIVNGQKRLEDIFGQHHVLLERFRKIIPLGLEENVIQYEFVKRDMADFEQMYSQSKSPKEYIALYLDRELIEQLSILETYRFNVLSLEKSFLDYIDQNSNVVSCGYDYFEAIATINKSVILPGEEVEIYAGVGSFSESARPEITINACPLKLENGMVTYKFKAKENVGSHTIPLQIKYTKPDGTPVVLTKNIIYNTVDSICK
ncbi:MAG: hypothetical protein KA242_08700 [Chitinophagales bacterium]|nr:hypothetical protein [Chitinophagales bacterium]